MSCVQFQRCLGAAILHGCAACLSSAALAATAQPPPATDASGLGFVIATTAGAALCVVLLTLWRLRASSPHRHNRAPAHLVEAVADAGPALLWLSDTQGACIWVNARWRHFTGHSNEAARGDGWLYAIAAEGRDAARDFARTGASARRPCTMTFPMTRHDGIVRHMVAEGRPYHDTHGHYAGFCISCLDVTDLMEARRALEESERRFSTLVTNIPGAVYRCSSTPPWHMQFLSAGAANITGIPVSRFTDGTLTWESIVHPDDRAMLNHPVIEAINAPDGHFSLSYRIITAHGETRHMMEYGRPVKDSTGNVRYLDGVIFDVTEQQAISEALRDMRDFLHDVLEAMPSALVGFDVQGRVVQWNRVAESMTGVAAEGALDMPARDATRLLAGDDPRLLLALEHRTPDTFSRLSVYRDDGMHHVDVQTFTAGVADVLVMRVDDVTRRVRLEEALLQSEKMLSIGGLAAGMAHEMNNPLGAILQGAQNIQRRLDPALPANRAAAEEAHCPLDAMQSYMVARGIPGFLDGIQNAGARAASLVAHMLEFIRPSQGERTAIGLTTIIDRALALAGNDYSDNMNHDFRTLGIVRDYDPTDDIISCIPAELEQVFLNLFRNAAQAMRDKTYPEGISPELHIVTRVLPSEVRVDVIDNGPGISPAVRKRIFEPFFSTRDAGKGVGMGLAIAYFIITTNHGGTIECASRPGEGTRLTIRLPRDEGTTADPR